MPTFWESTVYQVAGIQSAGSRMHIALGITEYLRRVAITAAREREIDAIVTNSDGDPERRRAPTRIHRGGRFGRGGGPWGRRSKVGRLSVSGRAVPLSVIGPSTAGTEGQDDGRASTATWKYGTPKTPADCHLDALPGPSTDLRTAGRQDRDELFARGALVWPDTGIVINESHDRAQAIIRAISHLSKTTRSCLISVLPDTHERVATRQRVFAKWNLDRALNVEFRSLQEGRRDGLRIITQARDGSLRPTLVDSPSYSLLCRGSPGAGCHRG